MSDTTNMPCPLCRVSLVMSDRQGVEIDFCPQCRGVWLDRGELDKIVERSRDFGEPQRARGGPVPYPDHRSHSHGHHKRRKSFFEELFD